MPPESRIVTYDGPPDHTIDLIVLRDIINSQHIGSILQNAVSVGEHAARCGFGLSTNECERVRLAAQTCLQKRRWGESKARAIQIAENQLTGA